MIQRIQTVYLLLTTLLAVLFLSGTIINFSADFERLTLELKGIFNVPETGPAESIRSLPILSVLMIIVPAVSLLSIFIYKNRKLQIRLIILLIVLILAEAAAVVYYALYIEKAFNAEPIYDINLIFPFLMLLFSILACRSVRKDENLVRSYDRLR